MYRIYYPFILAEKTWPSGLGFLLSAISAIFIATYVKRIKSLAYSDAALTLKVTLNEEITDDYMVIYIPDEYHPTFYVSPDTEDGKIPQWVGAVSCCPTNLDPSLAPPGKKLISFIACCRPHQDWKQWGKVMLNNFYRVHPQARDKISDYWLETPEMYNAIGGEEGSIIGIAQTVDQVRDLPVPSLPAPRATPADPPWTTARMKCPKCQTEVSPDDKFCRECAYDLRKAEGLPPKDFRVPHSYTPKHHTDRILTNRSSGKGPGGMKSLPYRAPAC